MASKYEICLPTNSIRDALRYINITYDNIYSTLVGLFESEINTKLKSHAKEVLNKYK